MSKKAKKPIPKKDDSHQARSMGFLDFIDADADGNIVGVGEEKTEKVVPRGQSVGFLGMLDDETIQSMTPVRVRASALHFSPPEEPQFLCCETRTMEGKEELFTPSEKLMARPTKNEYNVYLDWLERVNDGSGAPSSPASATDSGSDDEENDEGLIQITSQLCVFLWFLRQGIPWTHMLPENFHTIDEWAQLKRKPWKAVTTLAIPTLCDDYLWWFKREAPSLSSLRQKQAVEICHKLQTSTKGMEVKDRVFLRKQFETFATAQKLEHERTGRIPDYERLDWTVEATSMWLSACKMRRSADTDSSIKLLEGSMWKRNKIGEWVLYFYVVSGSDTIPGLLSEYKEKDELKMRPYKTYQLRKYTPQEVTVSFGKSGKCFQLYKEGKAPIYFKCPTRAAKVEWLSLLITYSDAPAMEISADLFSNASVVANDKGKILQFNSAAEELFRQQAHRVIGKNVTMLMPELYRKPHAKYMAQYKKSRKKRIIGKTREVTIVTSEGVEQAVLVCIGEFTDAATRKRLFLATFTSKEEFFKVERDSDESSVSTRDDYTEVE